MISTAIITNMDERTKKRIRLIFNPKDQFPSKLYDVCNDGYLMRWNRNGSVSVPNEEAFETEVMELYPGFLQIPSFVNLRRLFREYGFDWVVTQDNIVEFSHPLFVRGRKQLLTEIKTRRRAFKSDRPAASSSSEIIETDPGKRYSTRKRRRTKHFTVAADGINKPDFQAGGEHTYVQISQNGYGGLHTQTLPPGVQFIPPAQLQIQKPEVRQQVDTKDIQQNFVQNELTEEEFMQWLARKRMIDEMKAKENVPETVNKEYVWMYYDNNGGRPEFENTKNGELILSPAPNENKNDKPKALEVPCGMCKCCVAMSLLSADNSVVTDESFMVDLDSDVEVTEVIVEEHDPNHSPVNKKYKLAQEEPTENPPIAEESAVQDSVQTESTQSILKEYSPDEEYPASTESTLKESTECSTDEQYQPMEYTESTVKGESLPNQEQSTQTIIQLHSTLPVSAKEEYVEYGQPSKAILIESTESVMKESAQEAAEPATEPAKLEALLPEPKYLEHRQCAKVECA